MRKFEEVFNMLVELRSVLRGDRTKAIKRFLGDSINNNRTLTVSQVIRYLNKAKYRKLSTAVQIATNVLENSIIERRVNRTDAIDINELVSTYRTVVMNGRSDTYRRRIGNLVSKVG